MAIFKILTNDPSVTAWGYAVLDLYGTVYAARAIKTHPGEARRIYNDDRRRYTEIISELLDVIKTHNVSYILAEAPHGSQNATAAKMVGFTSGAIVTMSLSLGLPLEQFSEHDVKMGLFGKKNVEKSEMEDFIYPQYPTIVKPRYKWISEAVADSIGVYHHAMATSVKLDRIKSSLL
jgi:Holliday junction resolvasome RuvABC endonuclease subunit